MMTCKEYIFKLTSGQLDDAGNLDRMWAFQHRLICRRCRAFARNDGKLGQLLASYRAHLTDASPDDVEKPARQ